MLSRRPKENVLDSVELVFFNESWGAEDSELELCRVDEDVVPLDSV